jgi:O-methyltransferase
LDATTDTPGDIIECGSFLCGTTACMALHLQTQGSEKHIFACDTFEGFDAAEYARERQRGDACPDQDFSDNDFAYVERKLQRLGVAERITLVRGLFEETLPSLPGPFSLAFIDCDLCDSLLYAGRTVWPRLSAGGCCVFDDYANDRFRGATKAIETFLAEFSGSISEHGPLSKKMYFARKRTA